MMIQPHLAVGLLLALATPAVGYPNFMNDARIADCATGNCAAMGGHGTPQRVTQPGSVLTVTGKTDGGTYTPGETLNLAINGNGQSLLAGYADGQVLDGGETGQGTITALQSEELVLIGLRAPASGQTVA